MGRSGTTWRQGATVLLATAILVPARVLAQSVPADWYHLGNSLIDLSLAGLATGPANRIWYSPDGETLFVSTASGREFQTSDFENWQPASEPPPPPEDPGIVRRLPETAAQLRGRSGTSATIYAFGKFAYQSQNGGASWDNLTDYRSQSIVGELHDLAVSPTNPEEVTVASSAGVFRSLDGGKSWSGLNQGLPNLPVRRIRALPSGERGVQVELSSDGSAAIDVVEWQPGEKQAWRPSDPAAAVTEYQLRQALSVARGVEVTALRIAGNTVYTGTADGRISVSTDAGLSWQTRAIDQGGPVNAFWVDPDDPRVALAVLGSRPRDASSGAEIHVMRTENAGGFWDDLTSNLPDVPANGVTASRSGGAIYVATEAGVFYTRSDLNALGAGTPWVQIPGLPQGSAEDVQLDAAGNQLWVAVQGFGIYSTLAPHRLGDPKVVSAADMVARAAAPGSLMSVVGARVAAARAGDLSVPVLAASGNESQIQIPFEARGGTVSLSIEGSAGRRALPALPLETASPAIFVDRDGSPMLLDASTGTMLDTMNPAHSRSRIQILATGLGRVTPDWPTGLAAPIENPPRVAADVQAWLDGVPVDVTRAVLAPGYVGMYLVEIELRKIVNYGPAELYLSVDGHPSNRVRVYIEP